MTEKALYPNNLRFDLSADQIKALGEEIQAKSQAHLDLIAATQDPTWETILQLSDESAIFGSGFSNCYFPSYVSADKNIRDASSETYTKLEAYAIEKSFRHDVYSVVQRYAQKHDASKFNAEENRFLEKVLEAYERKLLRVSLRIW
eukprot:TRINITY_DN17134_c0_g1_i1.p1 TRINITY_DN17134_c0_g1~~TRINITY_DN17134_c0_g1_i1.p1  ORF type:complete len:146 (-),score=23.64 TRINITY_DN17134_c0_g1_i1:45-482(-)